MLDVLGVRLLEASRRTPAALVEIALDGVPVTFGYVELRRDRWEVWPPKNDGGDFAIIADDDLKDRIADLAAQAVWGDAELMRKIRIWRHRPCAER
ncbi:hypothetical protein [Sediminicoccus sp. BL-A-41-H5]|uniref:hypothetical protein n=1 Tax=Sediminicoccus sp. BL-A-41-H5 TaxID=3421106 RepID=UPI003D6771FF